MSKERSADPFLTPEEIAEDAKELREWQGREQMSDVLKGLNLGRTTIKQLTDAWEALPLQVQEYIGLEFSSREATDAERIERSSRQMALLNEIMGNTERLLHPMTDFFVLRDKFVTQLHPKTDISQLYDRTHLAGSPTFRTPDKGGEGK